ncbi:MAG TPA: hypothetical protein VK901_07325 [Nitrospiraceae bacterium]|nr:hypothetical protein [Nitrospiraceae bacterium]
MPSHKGGCISARWLELNQELVKQGWWWYRKYALGGMVQERLGIAPFLKKTMG